MASVSVQETALAAAPVLSTPDTFMFEDPTPTLDSYLTASLSDQELFSVYEIQQTADEIQRRGYRHVALQFPDEMLPHSVRVYQALERALADSQTRGNIKETDMQSIEASLASVALDATMRIAQLHILADTSYSPCCADELAAEHVSAEAIVHYGRACLSPTRRLPVIHVFTKQPLDIDLAISKFESAFPPDSNQKVILIGDLPYEWHLASLHEILVSKGYKESDIFVSKLVSNAEAAIPNRSLPDDVMRQLRPGERNTMGEWSVFHLGEPPTALLLILASQIQAPASLSIYTSSSSPLLSTPALIRRRYALLTRISSAPILGLLTAAPSSANLLPTLTLLTERIKAAGKKSYLISVGKMTSAKVANFAEVDMWVIAGCWQSSIIDSSGFMAPMVTAWEALMALEGRIGEVFGGVWRGGVEVNEAGAEGRRDPSVGDLQESNFENDEGDDEDEPEYDLRTGRLISARPMRTKASRPKRGIEQEKDSETNANAALVKRSDKHELAAVGGVVSPGAEFLREKRTWQGLGSDFETDFTTAGDAGHGAVVEEGRSGVARGYTHEKT